MHTKKFLVGLLAAFSATAAYAGGTVRPAPMEAPAQMAPEPAPYVAPAPAPAPVVVAPAFVPHGYVGASIGRTDYSGSTPTSNPAAATYTVAHPGNATGGKVFAGYQWSPNMAAELTYASLGSSEGVRGQGFAADLLGIMPLGAGNWGLFGKIGIADMHASGAWNDSNKAGANYGIGVSYNLSHALGFRAEAERFQKVGPDLAANLYSVGLQYNF
jgi:OmpA-OmpF porin, OOP family